MHLHDVCIRGWNQARMRLCDRCVTVAVCIVQNANASHTNGILITWYQVHGAGSLATFKGVYGTVCGLWTHRTHITGDALWSKVNVNVCRKRHADAPHTQYRRRSVTLPGQWLDGMAEPVSILAGGCWVRTLLLFVSSVYQLNSQIKYSLIPQYGWTANLI